MNKEKLIHFEYQSELKIVLNSWKNS